MLNIVQMLANYGATYRKKATEADVFVKYDILDRYYTELEYIYIEYLLHAANLRFIDYKEGIKNIKKVATIMKEKFPKWQKNKYYKQSSIKYKVMCNLFYYHKIQIIKVLRSK